MKYLCSVGVQFGGEWSLPIKMETERGMIWTTDHNEFCLGCFHVIIENNLLNSTDKALKHSGPKIIWPHLCLNITVLNNKISNKMAFKLNISQKISLLGFKWWSNTLLKILKSILTLSSWELTGTDFIHLQQKIKITKNTNHQLDKVNAKMLILRKFLYDYKSHLV